MLEDKDFELLDETPVAGEIVNDEEITSEDFTLTEVDSSVHEQKFQTRPTTFLKDSLKRFGKNKSSVVAAYILGGLLLMSVLVPIFDKSDLSDKNPNAANETYLAPKLFKAGTGWWDGTVSYKDIAVDVSAMPDAKTDEEKQQYWWPSSKSFPQRSAISKKKFTEEKYTNNLSNGDFAKEGYVHFGYLRTDPIGEAVNFSTKVIPTLSLEDNLYLTAFDTYDIEKIRVMEGKDHINYPDNWEIDDSAFYFTYADKDEQGEDIEKDVKLVDYAKVHNIGSGVASLKEDKLDIAKIIKDETGKDLFENAYFSVRMETEHHGKNVATFIRSITFESESTDAKTKQMFEDMSFTDATRALTKTSDSGYEYWSSTGQRLVFLAKAHFCSFVYDTYDAKFGIKEFNNFSILKLLDYEDYGWISFKDAEGYKTLEYVTDGDNPGFYLKEDTFTCTILNKEKCPLVREVRLSDFYGNDGLGSLQVKASVYQYKYNGYDKIPTYLMGTDKSGRDMFKYVFEGLRTSLVLGIITFLVCFTFGLIWGSISGYFGGTVDLVMERIVEIIGNIPWFVLMTIIILHFGQGFITFAIALCAVNWIGPASRTRTQFYRFRGREYVLASRTLGASDARLIYKHILPNGLGTIITGSILMIPGVIFSESNIAYLGLGLRGLSSLGVILADNQSELFTNPYLLIFPAIVIALVMISFNLFGNGLRDAFNPSLKGEE